MPEKKLRAAPSIAQKKASVAQTSEQESSKLNAANDLWDPGTADSDKAEFARNVAKMLSSFIRADALIIEKPNWLVKGWLELGTTSWFYGPSNVGKSALLIDLAAHIAEKQNWFGNLVKGREGGMVIYIAAEGQQGVARRVIAWRKRRGKGLKNLLLFPKPLDLKSKQDTDILIATIRKEGWVVDLVVVDTLTRTLGGGDDSSQPDMTAHCNNCERIAKATGAHVTVIHHTGHSDRNRARGSSAGRAAVDSEFSVVKKKCGTVTVVATKQRDIEKSGKLSYKITGERLARDEDGDWFSAAVIVPVHGSGEDEQAYKLSSPATTALEVLVKLSKQSESVDEAPILRAIDWRDEYFKLAEFQSVKRDTLRQTFRRACEKLLEAGLVEEIRASGDPVKKSGDVGVETRQNLGTRHFRLVLGSIET